MEKLTQIKNNQIVTENGGILIFYSYNAKIAEITNAKNQNLIFTNSWNYSKTTLKYLYQFLTIYKNNLSCDIYTKIIDALSSNNIKQALKNLINLKVIKLEA